MDCRYRGIVGGSLLVFGLTACGDQLTPVGLVPNLDVATAVAYDCTGQSQIPPSECDALVALYNETNGPGWTSGTDWLATATPCLWRGVTCSSGHVTHINLDRNQLVGSIPLTLANLTALQWLNLYGNKLGGSLPENLGTLTQLRGLILYINELSGPIPATLANLPLLRLLYLSMNQLTGPIPAEFGNLSALEELNLNNNNLTGGIPSSLGNLTSLWKLGLSSNPLGGTIPRELGNLSSLRDLRLCSNQLTGPIPAELGNLTRLAVVEICGNALTGEIPDLSRLDNLVMLNAHYNQLTGPVPASLGDLASLRQLYLRQNRLSGPLPEELGRLTKLTDLDLSYNRLSGPMPLSLAVRVEPLAPDIPGIARCFIWAGVPWTNEDFHVPDLPEYRAADRDGDGFICGTSFRVRTNQPPTVSAGGPYTVLEGSPVVLTGVATDPNGDPVTWSWVATPDAGVDAGASCTFTNATTSQPAIACDDDGTFSITVTVSDGVNTPVSSTAELTVINAAPAVTGLMLPVAPVAVGNQVEVSAAWSDAGTNDSHHGSVEWDAGLGFEDALVGAGTISARSTALQTGVYTVTLRVTDDEGDAGAQTSVGYVVVYDPTGSFVTGGGWIWSPAGSSPADPALEGRANFGFVSRYQKGATAPSGNTEFQFKTGRLNFSSTSYQWLVVAGARAQYKGVGTINGAGSFGFLLTAIDGAVTGGGDLDRFRIKIWETTTGAIVYDNQPGILDDSDAATVLGGGSITIHR